MSLNDTPLGERIHIGIFGRRNAGKSSLINAITNQHLAIVSDIPGTTTDPVSKTMELSGLGPVVITDTAGLDDTGTLGKMRTEKTLQVLNNTDIVLIAADGQEGLSAFENELIKTVEDKNIPYLVVFTKSDIGMPEDPKENLCVSSKTGENIFELKEKIIALKPKKLNDIPLLSDKLHPGERVVLVVPIDAAAPKGRIILPQQMVLREVLDCGCTAVVCKPSELSDTFNSFKTPPDLVITDSQAFGKIAPLVPRDITLTSFSIIMARYKGDLEYQLKGTEALDHISDGDKILISEGCTHHRQCGDIGTVKLPMMVRKYTKSEPQFTFTSGKEFPEDLSGYSLVIHCGGCMLDAREMRHRIDTAEKAGIPVTNYGMCLAKCSGILDRSMEIFR